MRSDREDLDLRKLAVLALLVTAAIFYFIETQRRPPSHSSLASPDPQLVYDAAAAIEKQWLDFKAKKIGTPPRYGDLLNSSRLLGEIDASWPGADDASALLKRLRADESAIQKAWEAEEKKRKEAAVSEREKRLILVRRDYAKIAEKAFLDAGYDVYVTVEGKDHRILRIKYVLMGRPLVHQISNNAQLLSTWRDAGFHKVMLTDGSNQAWNLDLR